ncbi:MAG: flagellar type III secretion system pore protein FliP [Planctomycetota bacterium]|nr:flagellar type III secretion system pore protein FliP [Planctomycetota bacterium]
MIRLRAAALVLPLLTLASARAQDALFVGPPAPETVQAPLMNPVSMLEAAAQAAPGLGGDLSSTLNIIFLLTVLSLAPAIMVMCTCFVRFIIVFALLKQALGAQNIPPAQVITGLSLFMTFLVMAPTFDRINREALVPYDRGEIATQAEMWDRAKQPLRDFMFAQIDAAENWSSLYMILNYRGVDTSRPERLTRADVDMLTLVPAYMLSELKVAFLMGFRVYLPFLIIDMVISALLISMSMMMLPPVLISLPFKLLLFVLVDGWQLVVGSLLQSVVQPAAG